MKNIVALSLLLAGLAAVVFLSPDPLYVRSAEVGAQQDEGVAASVSKNVQEASREAYQTASEFAEKTGEGIRQMGANVADKVSSVVGGGQPEQQQPQEPLCDDVGTEQRSLLDRATEAVTGKPTGKEESVGLSAGSDVGSDVRSSSAAEEEVSSWQRAKEKLNEASHAASEAAAHVKEALFHRPAKTAAQTAKESAGRAKDTLAGAAEKAAETVQEGAQAAYDTLGSAAEKAKETVGSAFSSAQDTSSRGAGAREAAGSAYERVADVFDRDDAGGPAAYRAARERAGAALDQALEKVGSAYDVMYMAIEILAENVRTIPSKTPQYAGSASDRLGSATRSAREAVNRAGSSAYDTVKQVPESVQETVEYVKGKMPDVSAEGLRQKAREAGEYLPNVGEGLSYGWGKDEPGVLESLRRKLALGRTEEERRGILEQFRDSLGGYSREERAGLMERLLKKVPGYGDEEEEQQQGLLESLKRRLALGQTEEERRSILERFKDSLPGHSREEREGLMEQLLRKLGYYGSSSSTKSSAEEEEEEGVLESLKRKLAMGKTEEERRGILDQFKDRLSGYSQEERAGITEGLLDKARAWASSR